MSWGRVWEAIKFLRDIAEFVGGWKVVIGLLAGAIATVWAIIYHRIFEIQIAGYGLLIAASVAALLLIAGNRHRTTVSPASDGVAPASLSPPIPSPSDWSTVQIRASDITEFQIAEWLFYSGYFLQKSPAPMTEFHIMCRDEQGFFEVFRPLGMNNLRLQAVRTPNAEEQQKFDALTGRDDATIFEELKLEFAKLGEIGYTGLGHPLRQVVLTHEITYDKVLTATIFAQYVRHIRRAVTVLEQTLKKALKQSSPPS